MRRFSFCVAVCSLVAEHVRRLLVRFGVLDRKLKVEKVESDVFSYFMENCRELVLFPLSRHLSEPEAEQLKSVAFFLHVCLFSFSVRSKPPDLFELLEGVLPKELFVCIPRSFDIIGDVAVLELKPELWRFRFEIGEAVLKVNRHLKAVYVKGGRVNGVHRVRRLVHVAGEKRTLTLHKENGCVFKVDVASAYFSPRLSEERVRVADQVRAGEVVVDLFAGVGPFAILIAKRRRGIVHAIDINPSAFQLLKENIELNKVSDLVFPYLGDCKKIVNDHLKGIADHVIMNLPGSAYEFIDVACSALRKDGGVIHYYQFGRGETACEDVAAFFKDRVEEAEADVLKILNVRRVRPTAPREWQVAVDAFVVPYSH